MEITAIILAGGSGKRMNTDVKKQYLLLEDKPILFYSLRAFEESRATDIILVVPEGEEESVKASIVDKYSFKKVRKVVAGGKERVDSVYNGLKAADGSSYVLIHDGARPLIKTETINMAIDKVKETGACLVGVRAKDTIHITDNDNTVKTTPERSKLFIAQTPQCFEYKLAVSAFEKAMEGNKEGLTDDVSVVAGYTNAKISLVEGEYTNIKITTPEDMVTAKAFL
ncbi:MAG: 2-C-methyl-D-erythritol 4-phosphate cytidylyltransferase [Lachnospiraceae bacterium]|nr:2-C-methyl-D-erythritol 4-phosphate cytidylyltransferase [Lachnospiraceae bacterium]